MKENKRKLLIPTTEENRKYFEACLRQNETHCPYGGKRETSSDCPFYFAGGGCSGCTAYDREMHQIIRAWTRAIAAKAGRAG